MQRRTREVQRVAARSVLQIAVSSSGWAASDWTGLTRCVCVCVGVSACVQKLPRPGRGEG
jgi:hypothetical protein